MNWISYVPLPPFASTTFFSSSIRVPPDAAHKRGFHSHQSVSGAIGFFPIFFFLFPNPCDQVSKLWKTLYSEPKRLYQHACHDTSLIVGEILILSDKPSASLLVLSVEATPTFPVRIKSLFVAPSASSPTPEP